MVCSRDWSVPVLGPWDQPQVVNDADSARLLLEAGAQLEAIDDTGRTPLALAAAYGNLEAPVLR